MAHRSNPSVAASGGPHAVSLKVLRLSRPSLSAHTPLPRTNFGNGLDIPLNAFRACAIDDEQSSFPLTPQLTLPAAFGAAFVGETFACTLCANSEVREGDSRSVSGVRIAAEIQTPSTPAGTTLELESAGDVRDDALDLTARETVQRTLRHELREEGQHVLAITVYYTETLRGEDGGASGGRARTFRKLYQFVAQQLIVVRSKVTERKRREKDAPRSWVLEAQLENLGEASAVLEKVWLNKKPAFSSRAYNGGEGKDAVVLKPQDVEQVMFILEEREKGEETGARVPLAQLNIDWRSAMGERGSLTTGWLASRAR